MNESKLEEQVAELSLDNNLMLAMENMGVLLQALSHYSRHTKTRIENKDEIVNALVDVIDMVDRLKILLSIDAIDINKAREKKENRIGSDF